ncbi:killer toxin [Mycena sp. CBHHK59/15]|nr:killer toxin [Mycena sp. CBHHK59/15]
MKFRLLSLLLLSAATHLSAGVNCEGSSNCRFGTTTTASSLAAYINTIGDLVWYNNGDHIACVGLVAGGRFCAFVQGSPGGGLGVIDIKPLAAAIVAHGCKTCGSQPFFDGSPGLLTFNWVQPDESKAQFCDGVCQPGGVQ